MTTKTKRPFVIDPHSPDVETFVPIFYTEARIKRGVKWAPVFFRWLKRAKVRNDRYYLLDRAKGCSDYYDILTHSIYRVYPPFKLDTKPKARRLTLCNAPFSSHPRRKAASRPR